MLLAFRATNARSFREEVELSLVATALAVEGIPREVPRSSDGRTALVLPAAGVFGPNASGKSNLLRVLDDLRGNVLASFRRPPGRGISRHHFRLGPDAADAPTRFEVDLVLNGVEHHYALEVDDTGVLEESVARYPYGRRAVLFERTNGMLRFGSSGIADSRAAESVLRADALFLSTAAATGHRQLAPLYAWFERNLLLMDTRSRAARQLFTASLLDARDTERSVRSLLRAADLGVTGATRVPVDPEILDRVAHAVHILSGGEGEPDPEAPPAIDELGVHLTHQSPEGDVELHPDDESLGTLVWFGLVGPVIRALLEGSVLLADELDASLHPTLVRRLVDLFQDPDRNPNRAQLIFNTHDTTLLPDSTGEGALGRDQVWFTEKLRDGSTRLTALAEFAPRRDEAVRRRYLAGRYGAVPLTTAAEFDPLLAGHPSG